MSGARDGEKLQTESVLAARRWLFGPAVLDERSLTLVVNDQSVELERKPLEVLLHLLHHAGEIVTKDELLAAVWPGRVLSDSALTSCMHKLREALSDEAQEIIRTQHGYGYRLVAPVRVETSTSPAPPHFNFKAGDHPPLRPQWGLVQRLGTGGHGETWLAQHDKTREARTFKFALDGASLTSLKREITLSRLLHDALGGRSDMVRVLDWNLEEAPYFIEAGYSQSGSLVNWAKTQGGLDTVPLATRVDLVAQIADALAAAHSVGVLHKDLKPSNVLIDVVEDKPRIKLSDFGSGGVLDLQRLEEMGITRMGFTQAVSPLDTTSGTPLYLAPEVVSGQPFTLQSDIYALGVVLYQLVIGDFSKPLAPGWEQDVADEMLRDDIAAAADGHPSQRLTDAAVIAARLRTLDQRRAQRAAERLAKEEAERAQLEVERVRARRTWVRLSVGAVTAGFVASTLLYLDARQARNLAAEAAATSKAVSDFMSKDLFATITSNRRSVKDLTVKELLDSAGGSVDQRFEGRPEVAAQVHAALGESYALLEHPVEAKPHLESALELFEGQQGGGSEAAVDLAAKLVIQKYVQGELKAALPHYEDILRQGTLRLGRDHPKVLQLRRKIAQGQLLLGSWVAAAAQLHELVKDASAGAQADVQLLGEAEETLARLLVLVAEFGEAERVSRDAIRHVAQALGEEHSTAYSARLSLARSLMEQARFDEADAELSTAIAHARRWKKDDSGDLVSLQRDLGRLRLEQNRPEDAIAILKQVLAVLATFPGSDQSVTVRHLLGEAYQRAGRLEPAAAELRLALNAGEKTRGVHHPITQNIRISLGDVLREQGRLAEAREVLRAVVVPMPNLPERHPYLAHLRRAQGLLASKEGRRAEARQSLQEAAAIYEFRYGGEHWRTRRVRAELASVPPDSEPSRGGP